MKGRMALGSATVLADSRAAVGTVVATVGAAGSRDLPQGFRYAAEIQAKVDDDGTDKIRRAGLRRRETTRAYPR